MKLLLVGTPRGGTGYSTVFLRPFGLQIGHETPARDGIADWGMLPHMLDIPNQLTHNLRYKGMPFEYIIHLVREPYDCITTMANVYGTSFVYENDDVDVNIINVCSIAKDINPEIYKGLSDPFNVCAKAYLLWHEHIDKLGPHFTFVIEKNHDEFIKFLHARGLIKNDMLNAPQQKSPVTLKDTNPKKDRTYSRSDTITNINLDIRQELEKFRAKYYEKENLRI